MDTLTATPTAQVEPAEAHLIVFGRDEGGKAHASWFTSAEAELATKAAELMGMATLMVSTDEHRAEAARLARGRVFGSGRAFVPFAKAAAYERLRGFAGHTQAEAPTAKVARGGVGQHVTSTPMPAAPTRSQADAQGAGSTAKAIPAASDGPVDARSSHRPTRMDEIRVGSLVLAPEHDNISWWAAVVVRVESQGRFTLKWRDFWHEAPFEREVGQLGLLNPTVASART